MSSMPMKRFKYKAQLALGRDELFSFGRGLVLVAAAINFKICRPPGQAGNVLHV